MDGRDRRTRVERTAEWLRTVLLKVGGLWPTRPDDVAVIEEQLEDEREAAKERLRRAGNGR